MPLIVKSVNIYGIGRLQLLVQNKVRGNIFSVMLAWFMSLPILHFSQPRSQGLSFCHLGETLAAAGHVPPRFWEVN